jgi:hypothetical protein
MTDRDFVAFRAGAPLRRRLDELAEGRGLNRSAAIRAAILEATRHPSEPAVPDEHEVLVLLSESARGGNVAAMKELRAYHRECRSDRRLPDAVTPLDEIARRRDGPGRSREA